MIELFNNRRGAAGLVVACGLALSACGGGDGSGSGTGAAVALPTGIVVLPTSPASALVPGGQAPNPADGLVAATQGSTLIRPTPEGAGAQCAAGGTRVDSGIDANGNGLLDVAEVAATAFVCNGVPGLNGTNGTNGLNGATGPAGAVGPQGAAGTAGAAGATGLTGPAGAAGLAGPAGATGATGAAGAAGSTGAAGLAGAVGPAGPAGATGLATLLLTSAEPAGANCAAGGVKVQAGTDADRNGTLAAGEVSTTSFVCNGLNGVNGANGVGGSVKSWQNAARIDPGTPVINPNTIPQVAFDGNGNGLAVWGPRASSYSAATGWSAPVLITPSTLAGNSKIAVNARGDAVAVWAQYTLASGELWANRREGGVWKTPVRLDMGTTQGPRDFAVAINTSGDATVIWYEKRSTGQTDVKARRYQVFVSSWDAAVVTLQADVGGVSGDVYGLSVAMDDTSAAVAAYTRDAGASILVDIRRYRPATGWDGFVLAGGFTCLFRFCSAPKVLMNNIGHTLLVWAVNAMPGVVGSRRAVYAQRYSGGAWDTEMGLSSGMFNLTGEALMPDASMDSAGNAQAVWTEVVAGEVRSAVYTSRLTVPATGTPLWGASELLSGKGLTVVNPKVVLDSSGNAQAVWAQEDAASASSIWSSRFSTSTAWGSPSRIHTQPAGNAAYHQVAVDPTTGTVLALWLIRASGGGPDGIWANFLR